MAIKNKTNLESKANIRRFARDYWNSFVRESTAISKLKQNLINYLRVVSSESSRILAYRALADEVNYIDLLIRYNYTLFIPIVKSETDMEFRLFSSGGRIVADMVSSLKGPPGPDNNSLKLQLPLQKSDIVIIPALGCNKSGYRLGRGGGYYDRWRSIFSLTQKIGLIPEKLINCKFKQELHDLKFDIIFTEERKLIFQV